MGGRYTCYQYSTVFLKDLRKVPDVWCKYNFWSGDDSHHTWEATFKAFGEALRESLLPCPYRAGTTIGLKGTGMEGKL